MMDCAEICKSYARYLLLLFNFLFVVTGAIILSVGASVKAYYHEYDRFLDDKFIYASDLLIIIGVIIFAVAFFGFCGALKKNACMTLTFSSLLIVIFVLEVMVGIAGIVLKHQTDEMIERELRQTMREYDNNTGNTLEITALWDQVQTKFNCCGIHNVSDWKSQTNTTNGEIPISCCTFAPGATGNVSCDESSKVLHTTGCLDAFSDYIEGHAVSIESVGIALAIIQLLGIILSCYLSKQLRSDYETV